jgi:hypothetical protein
LGIFLFKLCQRTVERGSLTGSAACEGEWKGVQNDPFSSVLPEGDFFNMLISFFVELKPSADGNRHHGS